MYSVKKPQNKLLRDVLGNTDLLKARCDLYHPHYCYACHYYFNLTQLHSFIGCYFDKLTLFLNTGLRYSFGNF